MNATAPRTDRRRVRTRAALLKAGRSLFAARSVDAVSIDDIVAAADVAKGSFYNHYSDKEALAKDVALEVRRAVETKVAEANAGVADPAEQVARAVCLFARASVDDPEAARLALRLFPGADVPDAPMNAGVRASIKAGLESGRFHGVSVEAGVLMAVGVAQIAVSRALRLPRRSAALKLACELAFGLLRGLGGSPEESEALAEKASAEVFAERQEP